MQPHILIVDDDTRILKLLKKFFNQNNFLISTAQSVKEAKELLLYFVFDLLILDVMLPDITGLEFARFIKTSSTSMPIVMLTALGDPLDKIKGLETGVNDYLTKPFEPLELLLRVKNLIEVYNSNQKNVKIIWFGNNYYDYHTKTFIKNEKVVNLSYTEQKLLEILIEKNGCFISREELSERMGGLNLRSVDVQIVRIRNKIEDDPKEPQHIKTLRGKGYVLYT